VLGHSDHEPPYTAPYVRWCERTGAERLPPTRLIFWPFRPLGMILALTIRKKIDCKAMHSNVALHLLTNESFAKPPVKLLERS
jgi:hypothetical protein